MSNIQNPNAQNPNAQNTNAPNLNAREVNNDISIHDVTPSGNTGPRVGQNVNAPPPPIILGGHIDLTRFTQQLIDILLRVASVFPPPEVEARGNHEPEDEEERSEAHSQPRPSKSTASHLCPSQNTNYKNHGEQHPPETWKENRRVCDLRKEIEARQAEYEKARERLENRNREIPEGRNDTGSIDPTNADKLNTLMELKKRIEGGASGELGESPLTKMLEDEPKQRHIKHLNLNSFDGMRDPEEHLSYFNQLALHYEYRDLTKCRFFAATLRGNAQRWFSRIPARSIDTWADFKKAFLNKFRANQPHEVHTSYLQMIGQKEGESLQSYIDRFKEAVNKIICVNEIEALVHLKRGLDPYECAKYVVKLMEVQPTTLAKAYDPAS
ncbi:hypothetical protein ACET3Z_021166 [Daucus carota]